MEALGARAVRLHARPRLDRSGDGGPSPSTASSCQPAPISGKLRFPLPQKKLQNAPLTRQIVERGHHSRLQRQVPLCVRLREAGDDVVHIHRRLAAGPPTHHAAIAEQRPGRRPLRFGGEAPGRDGRRERRNRVRDRGALDARTKLTQQRGHEGLSVELEGHRGAAAHGVPLHERARAARSRASRARRRAPRPSRARGPGRPRLARPRAPRPDGTRSAAARLPGRATPGRDGACPPSRPKRRAWGAGEIDPARHALHGREGGLGLPRPLVFVGGVLEAAPAAGLRDRAARRGAVRPSRHFVHAEPREALLPLHDLPADLIAGEPAIDEDRQAAGVSGDAIAAGGDALDVDRRARAALKRPRLLAHGARTTPTRS